MPQTVFSTFCTNFRPMLDFVRVALIDVYELKCFVSLYLSAISYQFSHISCLGIKYLMQQSFYLKNFMAILDLVNTSFLGISALKCLCSPGSSPDWYQILHTYLLRWLVFLVVIGKLFFATFIPMLNLAKTFIPTFGLKCLCAPHLLPD